MNFSNAKIKFHPGIWGLKTSFQPTVLKRLIINYHKQNLILYRIIQQTKFIKFCTILSPSLESPYAEIISQKWVFLPNFQYLKQSLSIFFMNNHWTVFGRCFAFNSSFLLSLKQEVKEGIIKLKNSVRMKCFTKSEASQHISAI